MVLFVVSVCVDVVRNKSVVASNFFVYRDALNLFREVAFTVFADKALHVRATLFVNKIFYILLRFFDRSI